MPCFESFHCLQFRNLTDVRLNFHPRLNVFTGQNGAGKTNLLEALYYLALGKSCRNAPSKELIQFEKNGFLAEAEYLKNGKTHKVRAKGTPGGRAFFSGEKRVSRLADWVGNIPLVMFTPEAALLPSASPGERRRFLNLLLSQTDINYFLAIQKYLRLLKQRNSYLKTGAGDAGLFSVLTDSLIESGTIIREKRAALIDTIGPIANTHLRMLTKNQESLSAAFPSPAPLAEQAAEVKNKERMVKTTLFGPHRDDFTILMNNTSAKKFGSRGQQRAVSVAFKLAAVDFFMTKKGEPPVLLLDDVLSELDPARASQFLEVLGSKTQTFLTSPGRVSVLNQTDHSAFSVDRGQFFVQTQKKAATA